MSIATAITNAQNKVAAAYSSVNTMGGTLPATQNLSNLPTAIESIPSGGSGTTDVKLTRFKDDNNNEIGTHYMNFEDANGNVFKVILLDAQYRNASTQWLYVNSAVTNMPLYNNLKTANVWMAKETATTNTQLILDYCDSEGYWSTSCLHCRSQQFTINGVTYVGQLPNVEELLYLAKHYSEFDSLDTSASGHSSTNFSSARIIWSSSQYGVKYGWCLFNYGNLNAGTKSDEHFTCPVLEIPLS